MPLRLGGISGGENLVYWQLNSKCLSFIVNIFLLNGKACKAHMPFGQNTVLVSVMIFEEWKVDYNFTLSFQPLATISYVIVVK